MEGGGKKTTNFAFGMTLQSPRSQCMGMRRKDTRTAAEKKASMAPAMERRKALKETGLANDHIQTVVSGAAAVAKGDAIPLGSQRPSSLKRSAPKAARAEAAEASSVSTSGWAAVGRGAVGRWAPRG